MKSFLTMVTAFIILLASSSGFAAPKKAKVKKSYSESRSYKAKKKKKMLHKKNRKVNRKKKQTAS